MTLLQVKIDRASLYGEVWTTPVSRLAECYGISDVALKKVCWKMNVPTPPRGYWARVRHGHTVRKPRLHVHGDIHEAAGVHAPPFGAEGRITVNAAVLGASYRLALQPVVVDLRALDSHRIGGSLAVRHHLHSAAVGTAWRRSSNATTSSPP